MKVTIIGAGNVGSTCADLIVKKDIVEEVLLLDVKKNIAEGKALDIHQSSPITNSSTKITGITNKYSYTIDSNIVIITSGLPRKPGMSRDDLINTNVKIIQSVVKKIIHYSPECKIIIVSNPLDIMTYAAYRTVIDEGKNSEWASKNILGMAGILDTSRYRTFLADEIGCFPQDIHALLLGGHGDTMVPLPRYTTVSGIPITEFIKKDKLNSIIERTKKGGGEIVNLLGTSSWYSPGVSIVQMVESIVKNSKRILPCCAFLKGEYGIKGIYLGVPVVLSRNGIDRIIELKLNKDEKNLLNNSILHVKKIISMLDNMKIFKN